ncbi:hypothetical protein K501DRAFT_330326 [Backusella circina FSU 941]|nr:hypothetical protein K501DRAFT_330326 [Backusella circina FSU 941]
MEMHKMEHCFTLLVTMKRVFSFIYRLHGVLQPFRNAVTYHNQCQSRGFEKQVKEILRENELLTDENEHLIKENRKLEEEIRQKEDMLVSFVSENNRSKVTSIFKRNTTIKKHEATIDRLQRTVIALESNKKALEEQVKHYEVPQDPMEFLTNDIALSEIHDKPEFLENQFCKNNDEASTDRYKVLLKKVAAGRAKDWGDITNGIVYKYSFAKRRMNRVLKKLKKSESSGDRFNRLLDIVVAEQAEKVELWNICEERMKNLEELGRELFESQTQVTELMNRNEFLKETTRVLRKRKQEDGDDNEGIHPPFKK